MWKHSRQTSAPCDPWLAEPARELEEIALRRAARVIRQLMTPHSTFPARADLEGAWFALRELEAERAAQHPRAV